jgi:UDP-N-acetylglucosamine acyltransferase
MKAEDKLKGIEIHPSAIISPNATIGEGVKIGAYSIIDDNVTIGRNTIIGPHVVIEGHTRIGEGNRIYPFVTIGTPPQDLSYKGEYTQVIIGNGNIIREYVTIHRATTKEEWKTQIGNDNYLMAYSHVAHDCVLGNNIILSNGTTLGGHTHIGDHANLGGLVAVHQFVRIGAYAFVGGKTGVDRDVPPFMIAAGPRATLYGPNQKGLKRLGFSQEIIDDLKRAYRIIWREKRKLSEAIQLVKETLKPSHEIDMLISFIENSRRGILK